MRFVKLEIGRRQDRQSNRRQHDNEKPDRARRAHAEAAGRRGVASRTLGLAIRRGRSAQKAGAQICGLRSSKSIRAGQSSATLRRWPERRSRSRRLANAHPDKFANNRSPRRRSSKASRAAGKRASKNRDHSVVRYVSGRKRWSRPVAIG